MICLFEGKYHFLSNFYPCFANGMTVEHYYQSLKTTDPAWVVQIINAATPGKAKKLGGQCPLRSNWNELRDTVMLRLLRKKFSITALRDLLLATGEEKIVESNNWHDNYWGDCYCPRCSRIRGMNRLGEMLMEIRGEYEIPV